jgi:hypothetical protein
VDGVDDDDGGCCIHWYTVVVAAAAAVVVAVVDKLHCLYDDSFAGKPEHFEAFALIAKLN